MTNGHAAHPALITAVISTDRTIRRRSGVVADRAGVIGDVTRKSEHGIAVEGRVVDVFTIDHDMDWMEVAKIKLTANNYGAELTGQTEVLIERLRRRDHRSIRQNMCAM